MIRRRMLYVVVAAAWAALAGIAAPLAKVEETLPAGDVLLKALADEVERSMTLAMEDLEQPYFIQYTVNDSVGYSLGAEMGALTSSDRQRSRRLSSQVRVGAYELDNTNFSGDGGGFGGRGRRGGGGRSASLPLEDDYLALRQAIWLATDSAYKEAVETLTRKRAYMKDKNITDRPPDFSKAEASERLEPAVKLSFDQAGWEQRLKDLSGRFKKHPKVQDSRVRFIVGANHQYLVNSEGTRIRVCDTATLLVMSADVQAEDGMMLSNSRTYCALSPEGLPSQEELLLEADSLVEEITQAAAGPVLDSYTGPVLFDSVASCQLFRELLAAALEARMDPVGSQRGAFDLEKKLGQSILPDSFNVYDDPLREKEGEEILIGHYRMDDEGVPAQRVDLVQQGELKTLLMCRTPTRKIQGSNGHGRNGGRGGSQAAIGNLFVEDAKGLSEGELKQALIEAAKDQGLEYGLRVSALTSISMAPSQSALFSLIRGMQRSGGGESLSDPLIVRKVYVEDGREEMVRGIGFGPIKTKDLKDIAAGGATPVVYNLTSMGFGGASDASCIVAPSVLFEELELAKIEQEHPKPPILKAPLAR